MNIREATEQMCRLYREWNTVISKCQSELDEAMGSLEGALAAQAPAEGDALRCPACGSDRNERDELIKAEREVERLYARIVELAELVPIAEANERERCAQACEQLRVSNRTTIVAAEHYDECAAAIRSLSRSSPRK